MHTIYHKMYFFNKFQNYIKCIHFIFLFQIKLKNFLTHAIYLSINKFLYNDSRCCLILSPFSLFVSLVVSKKFSMYVTINIKFVWTYICVTLCSSTFYYPSSTEVSVCILPSLLTGSNYLVPVI